MKIHGAKNIKKYGSDELTILNPCHVSIYTSSFGFPAITHLPIQRTDYFDDKFVTKADFKNYI